MLILFACLICAAVASPSHFFSGAGSLSWDSDELTRVRSLHKRNFDDPANYTQSDNLASYLGLSRIEGVHLPIPVNVLLIGFDGDGNHDVEIRPEELHEWFETLDHIIPHTRVPLSELTCKEDGYCLSFERVRKPNPLHSYVHFNVSVHAIEVSRELSIQFAECLKSLLRETSVGTKEALIDVTGLENVVDGMLASLGILWSYNILLINPKLLKNYVYRAGLSKEEIDDLQDPKTMQRLMDEAKAIRNLLPLPPGNDQINKPWHPPRTGQKFDVKRLSRESSIWAQQVQTWIAQRQRLMDRVPKDLGSLKHILFMKGIHGDANLVEVMNIMMQNAQHRSDLKGPAGLRVLEPEEGCPMDLWAGHRRWIMMDFAASSQNWGPFIGGDGLKTYYTLPSIEKYFQSKPSFNPDIESEALKEKLVTQRVKYLEELHQYRVEGYIERDALRNAEIDLLNRFHSEHCVHANQPPVLCQSIDTALAKLANKEDIFTSKDGEDLFLEWFGMDEDVNPSELEHNARMKDLFLAHASSMVSRAIRHVFIPPTLTWKHVDSDDRDISMPYAIKVTFRIYLLSDAARDPRHRPVPFDIEGLKTELTALKLQGQDFHFIVQRQRISDDPILATSLAASLRSSTIEHFESETFLAIEERLYFDSVELQSLLYRHLLANDVSKHKNVPIQHSSLEVPLLILDLDRDRPIFIDQHYIARASENMVLVIHNSQYRGQHPLGITCGSSAVGQTLAAPLKAALGAVLQHLGGLLPPHLGYSPEHAAIAHDWTWSIGANPFSITSPGWKISQAQKDALHRTYFLDVIDLSIERVNHGIELLESVESSERSFEYVQKQSKELTELLGDFGTLIETWRRMMTDAGELDFQKVISRLSMVEGYTIKFLEAAKVVERGMKPLQCKESQFTLLGLLWLTDEVLGGCLLIGVGFALYKLLPKKRKGKKLD